MKKIFPILTFYIILSLLSCTPRENVSNENNFEDVALDFQQSENGTINSGTDYVNRYEYNDFTIDQNGVITEYTGNAVDVVIPAQINGMPVIAVGDRAFRDMGLVNVVISDNVTSIGYRAFASNVLMGITIPNSVISIGVRAFAHNQLTDVYIPGNVTEIHWAAFEDNQLTSVTISNGVAIIFYEAFLNNKLTSIVIPDSVTRIFGGAFSGNQITSVTIGSNVEFIDYFEHIGTMPIFDNNFEYFYNANGRKAGIYIFSDGQWSME